MKYNCNRCDFKLDNIYKVCPNCDMFIGFPNVLAIKYFDNEEILNKRYTEKKHPDNENFENAIHTKSYVIMNINFDFLFDLVCRDDTYKSYYKQVEDGIRKKASYHNEKRREIVDTALFGKYKDDIIFAALSLKNSNGLTSYGDYVVFLKNDSISKRTTFLEENSYTFASKNAKEIISGNIPLGYRAIWENKSKLSIAKLGDKIKKKTKCFSSILLHSDGDRNNDDFIEAHIYSSININNIFAIKQTKASSNNKNDLIKLMVIKDKLSNKNIKWIDHE